LLSTHTPIMHWHAYLFVINLDVLTRRMHIHIYIYEMFSFIPLLVILII